MAGFIRFPPTQNPESKRTIVKNIPCFLFLLGILLCSGCTSVLESIQMEVAKHSKTSQETGIREQPSLAGSATSPNAMASSPQAGNPDAAVFAGPAGPAKAAPTGADPQVAVETPNASAAKAKDGLNDVVADVLGSITQSVNAVQSPKGEKAGTPSPDANEVAGSMLAAAKVLAGNVVAALDVDKLGKGASSPNQNGTLLRSESVGGIARVPAPSPKREQVVNPWNSATRAAPGTPEACIEKFLSDLLDDREDALLAHLAADEPSSSVRNSALELLQTYRACLQSRVKMATRIQDVRRSNPEVAEADVEFVFSGRGGSTSLQKNFFCKLVGGKWKISAIERAEDSATMCKTNMRTICNAIYKRLSAGKGFPDSVSVLYEGGTSGQEPKCALAGGKPYVLDFNAENKTYSIRCPCSDTHPSHFLPIE